MTSPVLERNGKVWGSCHFSAKFLCIMFVIFYRVSAIIEAASHQHCGFAERSEGNGVGINSLAAAQMREADKNRRGKKQRGGFADDQEDAGDSIAKSYKKRRY